MVMRVNNYQYGFRIISLALDECTMEDLLNNNLDFVYLKDSGLYLFPENIKLEIDYHLIESLKAGHNYDVYELWQDGRMFLRFNTAIVDNYFFVTGKCNSNCIMCPSSDFSRKNGENTSIDKLITLAKHIPENTPHLTVTGGEPFLSGEEIFKFIYFLKRKFSYTEFLFLTNGRIFSIEKYANLLSEVLPSNSILAIPVHGSCPEVHDSITRANGSFRQTLIGIKRLLNLGIRVEVRLVVLKLNACDLDYIADCIIQEIPQIEYVSVIAMEMTGNAYKYREQVWISYKEAFESASNAIKKLLNHGIDVKIYNFPLCTVNSSYWTLCEKSISPHKVRYGQECNKCRYKETCGGVFAGTINMEIDELKALV